MPESAGEFSFPAALSAGAFGSICAVVVAEVWRQLDRRDRRFDLLRLIGTFVVSGSASNLSWILGCALAVFVGIFYGVFASAVIYAFELDASEWLVGVIAAVCLWILTGTTFTYLRILHPRVRKGEIPNPGPFALRASSSAAAELFVAHLVFGAVAGLIYGILA